MDGRTDRITVVNPRYRYASLARKNDLHVVYDIVYCEV